MSTENLPIYRIAISTATRDQKLRVGKGERKLRLSLKDDWGGSVYATFKNVTQIAAPEKDPITGDWVSDYQLSSTVDEGTIEFYSDDIIEGHSIGFTLTLVAVSFEKTNWSKTNSTMCSLLSKVEEDASYDLDKKDVPVWIRTKPNLSAYARRELKKFGVRIPKPNQDLVTAHLSVNEIVRLMRRRLIVCASAGQFH